MGYCVVVVLSVHLIDNTYKHSHTSFLNAESNNLCHESEQPIDFKIKSMVQP